MKIILVTLLLIGCASQRERAYMRSADIDNQVYRFARAVEMPKDTCVQKAIISKAIHDTLGYMTEIRKSTDMSRFHDYVRVYYQGEFLRDSMQAPEFVDVAEIGGGA